MSVFPSTVRWKAIWPVSETGARVEAGSASKPSRPAGLRSGLGLARRQPTSLTAGSRAIPTADRGDRDGADRDGGRAGAPRRDDAPPQDRPALAGRPGPLEGRLQHPVGQLAGASSWSHALIRSSTVRSRVMLSVHSVATAPRASASRAARSATRRVVKPGLHRAGRDAERLGDLGHGQPDVEVEDHDRSMLGLQAPEAALELVAIRQ